MTNKEIKTMIIAPLVAFAIAYLMAAFVNVSFNPMDWDIISRFLVSVFAPLLGLILGAGTNAINVK